LHSCEELDVPGVFHSSIVGPTSCQNLPTHPNAGTCSSLVICWTAAAMHVWALYIPYRLPRVLALLFRGGLLSLRQMSPWIGVGQYEYMDRSGTVRVHGQNCYRRGWEIEWPACFTHILRGPPHGQYSARLHRSVSVTLTTRIGTRTHNVSSRVEAVLYSL